MQTNIVVVYLSKLLTLPPAILQQLRPIFFMLYAKACEATQGLPIYVEIMDKKNLKLYNGLLTVTCQAKTADEDILPYAFVRIVVHDLNGHKHGKRRAFLQKRADKDGNVTFEVGFPFDFPAGKLHIEAFAEYTEHNVLPERPQDQHIVVYTPPQLTLQVEAPKLVDPNSQATITVHVDDKTAVVRVYDPTQRRRYSSPVNDKGFATITFDSPADLETLTLVINASTPSGRTSKKHSTTMIVKNLLYRPDATGPVKLVVQNGNLLHSIDFMSIPDALVETSIRGTLPKGVEILCRKPNEETGAGSMTVFISGFTLSFAEKLFWIRISAEYGGKYHEIEIPVLILPMDIPLKLTSKNLPSRLSRNDAITLTFSSAHGTTITVYTKDQQGYMHFVNRDIIGNDGTCTLSIWAPPSISGILNMTVKAENADSIAELSLPEIVIIEPLALPA